MRIAAINSVQQNKTNKQSFGILKPVKVTSDLSVLLKNGSEVVRLSDALVEVLQKQEANNLCDVDFFMSKGVTPVPSGPSINVTARNAGVVIGQFNIKQKAYKDLSPVNAIIKMLEDASELATKVKEA